MEIWNISCTVRSFKSLSKFEKGIFIALDSENLKDTVILCIPLLMFSFNFLTASCYILAGWLAGCMNRQLHLSACMHTCPHTRTHFFYAFSF